MIKKTIMRINKIKNIRSKQKASIYSELKIKRLRTKVTKLGVPFLRNKRKHNLLNRNEVLNVDFNFGKLKKLKVKIYNFKF